MKDVHLTEYYFDNILPVKMIAYSNRLARELCDNPDQLQRVTDQTDLKPLETPSSLTSKILHRSKIDALLAEFSKDPLLVEVLRDDPNQISDRTSVTTDTETETDEAVYIKAIDDLNALFSLSERCGINQLKAFRELVRPVAISQSPTETGLDKGAVSRELLSELRKLDEVHDKLWQKVLRIRANKRNEEYLMEDESP